MSRELDGWRDEIALIKEVFPELEKCGNLSLSQVATYENRCQRQVRKMFNFQPGGVIAIQDYAKARRRKALGMEPRIIK